MRGMRGERERGSIAKRWCGSQRRMKREEEGEEETRRSERQGHMVGEGEEW